MIVFAPYNKKCASFRTYQVSLHSSTTLEHMKETIDLKQSQNAGNCALPTANHYCNPEEDEEDSPCLFLPTRNASTTPATAVKRHASVSAPESSKWANYSNKNRRFILVFWILVVWPLGIYSSPRLMLATTSKFEPPFNSPSSEAKRVYNDAFADMGRMSESLMIVILSQNDRASADTLIDGTSTLYNSTRDFVFGMTTVMNELIDGYRSTFSVASEKIPPKRLQGNGGGAFESPSEALVNAQSYFSLARDGLLNLAKLAATKDGRTTVVAINFSVHPYKSMFLHSVMSYGKENIPDGVSVAFTGIDLFEEDSNQGGWDDLDFMHKYIGPASLLILALVLGNVTIMIVPLLAIVTSTLASTAIMSAVASFTEVAQSTPGVILAFTIAFSIDYSLFLLSRCTEEIAFGRGKNAAIVAMVKTAGHTIFVSALTISGCCLPVLAFPVKAIATVGLGAAVAIMSSFLVNISLTPALLYSSLGTWCLNPKKFFRVKCPNGVDMSRRAQMTFKSTFGTMRPTVYEHCDTSDRIEHGVELPEEVSNCYDEDRMQRSLWFRIGKTILDPWKATFILLATFGIVAPVAQFIPELVCSFDANQWLPLNSPSLDAFNSLGIEFSYGALAPYKLIFDGRATNTSVDSQETFAVINRLLEELSGKDFPATPNLSSYSGISTIGGLEVPFATYQTAIGCGVSCPNEALRTIAFLRENKFNAPGRMATSVHVVLEVDPFSAEGVDWLIDARRKIQVFSDNGMLQNFQVFIAGEAGELYDASVSTYSIFPKMVGATLVSVFVLVGAFFRSILVPLVSIASIFLTQAFVYGLIVLVYQRGVLDFLGIPSLSSVGGVFWLVPVSCFTIIIGLGLDYDIFLISRVLELRAEGYSHKSSVLLGMYKTRRVISAAGLIMAVALGGLLCSRIPMINQLSFILISAVLVDAFIVRTVVAPILLGFVGEMTWWPRKLPAESKEIPDK